MSLNVVSLFSLASRPRNWSNQELAEFYRVQASLSRAGVSVETEQGLSDEGDPWFVFCGSDSGDVIIHFARIDGEYVVASPAFGSCVQGRDFRALIEGLMEQHPVVMPREKEKGKFFIHPAALLVSLVATAFFKLCQGDALAAEGKDASLASLCPSGGGWSRSGGSSGSQGQTIALDERSAATLMVAVAAAVAWEHATGTDETHVKPVSSHVLEANATDLTTLEGQAQHASLQGPSIEDGHATPLGSSEAALHELNDQVVTPTAVVTAQSLEAPAPPAKTAEDAGHQSTGGDPIQVAGATNASPSLPAPRQADVAPEHQPQSSTQDKTAADTATPASSAAMAELKAVVGDQLATHLTGNSDSSEQQLILSLANAVIPTHGSTSPADPAAAGPTDEASAKPAVTTTPATPDGGFTATTTTNTPAPVPASVDDAVHQFMVDHADFQIMKYDHEVIIYDPSLTPSNAANAQQETFSFADGSSLMLIGLPAHSTTPTLV